MNVYRVTWAGMEPLEHFVIGADQIEAQNEALKVTKQLAILPRNIRLQEWSGADLQSLFESKTFEKLTLQQKLAVIAPAFMDCLKAIGRTAEYLEIVHIMNQCERS